MQHLAVPMSTQNGNRYGLRGKFRVYSQSRLQPKGKPLGPNEKKELPYHLYHPTRYTHHYQQLRENRSKIHSDLDKPTMYFTRQL